MPEPSRPSPAERTLRARAAAYRLHSLYDSRELTANARAAFNDRFTRQVDPDGSLPPDERQRRAACARKAYFADLAAKSARARRARRGVGTAPAVTGEDIRGGAAGSPATRVGRPGVAEPARRRQARWRTGPKGHRRSPGLRDW